MKMVIHMEEKKEEQKEVKKNPVPTNKNRYIPKADVEMMREEKYEESMTRYLDR